MDPLVYLQRSSCNGGEAALVTPVESLASVLSRHVDIQGAGISTGVVTQGALEVLHPCVDLHVSSEAAGMVT